MMKRLLLASLLFALPLTAQAQSAAEFFKNRKMTLITSASVGGGYDQYARLLARHMPKYLPGAPTMVVQNMPGAEGIKAANYLYSVAPRDGSVIGGLQRNTGLVKFYYPDNSSAQFDARKFIWLGSTQQEIGFFLLRKAGGATGLEGGWQPPECKPKGRPSLRWSRPWPSMPRGRPRNARWQGHGSPRGRRFSGSSIS
jgi:tripartite-type tricarboxylate transporter receptor subunit TctC